MTINLPTTLPPDYIGNGVPSETLTEYLNGEVYLGGLYIGTTAHIPGQGIGGNPAVFTEDLLDFLENGATDGRQLITLVGGFIDGNYQGNQVEISNLLTADGLSNILTDMVFLHSGPTGTPILPIMQPQELAQYVAQLGTVAQQAAELTLTQNGQLFVGTGAGVDYLGNTGAHQAQVLNPGAPVFQDDLASFVNATQGGFDSNVSNIGLISAPFDPAAILNTLLFDGLGTVSTAVAFEQSLIANPGPGQTAISDIGPAGPPGPAGAPGPAGPPGPGITSQQIATIEATVTQQVETYLLSTLPKNIHLNTSTVTTAVTTATNAALAPLGVTTDSSTTVAEPTHGHHADVHWHWGT